MPQRATFEHGAARLAADDRADRLEHLCSVTDDHVKHVVEGRGRRQGAQHAMHQLECAPFPQAPRISL